MSFETFRCLVHNKIPELRHATPRHQQRCGCEKCITAGYFQEALNRFRFKRCAQLKRHWEDRKARLAEAEKITIKSIRIGAVKRHTNCVSRAEAKYKEYLAYAFAVNKKGETQPRYRKAYNAIQEVLCTSDIPTADEGAEDVTAAKEGAEEVTAEEETSEAGVYCRAVDDQGKFAREWQYRGGGGTGR